MAVAESELAYVGFWLRIVATLIDALLLVVVTAPLDHLVYGTFLGLGDHINAGAEFFISWLLPAVLPTDGSEALWLGRTGPTDTQNPPPGK